MKSEELVDSKIELTSQEVRVVTELSIEAWDYIIRDMPINTGSLGIIPNYNSQPCYVRTVKNPDYEEDRIDEE